MTDTAIFFDLDGTLVQFDGAYEDVVAATMETHLGDAAPEVVGAYHEAFREAFGDLAAEPYHAAMATAADAAGVDDPDLDAMVATLREAEFDALVVDPAVEDSLASLGEDAALGVLTNGVEDWQRDKLAHVGLADRFDAVVTSYEAGVHKPEPGIFETAEGRLPADEYAMVGDSDDDVEGARAAGWVPIRYEDDDGGPGFWETVGALL
jgi:putative hydrolase of the HAD superfamily